jgi:cell wall-associated NlpC family hydrolase
MIRVALVILVACLIGSACRPSVRFRSAKKTQNINLKVDKNGLSNTDDLNTFIHDWLHTPYKYGGMSRTGIDCSGFTCLVMLHVYNLPAPRTAQEQYNKGRKLSDSRIERGDLVFFRNVRGKGVDHVGVYLGDGKFAHATESAGVVISNLNEDYYRKRYFGACRYGN